MPKSIDFYLSKGFDAKAAEYFANGRKKAVNVVPDKDYTIIITFDNGEKRLFDVKSFIKPDTAFEPLSRPEVFKRVYIDDLGSIAWDIDPEKDSNIHWDNKIDLSPDTCYMDGK